MEVTPLMLVFSFDLSLLMMVPGWSGWKEFLINSGMLFFLAGMTVVDRLPLRRND